MMYSYYHVKFPNNLLYGADVCPVEYYTKKYDFSKQVPQPFKYDANNYVVCIPSHVSQEWTSTWKYERFPLRCIYHCKILCHVDELSNTKKYTKKVFTHPN